MMAGTEVAERPVSCLAVRVGCLPGQIQNILLMSDHKELQVPNFSLNLIFPFLNQLRLQK